MKIETILNAYDISYARYCYIPEFDEPKFGRRMRQHRAFRDRILRMYHERDRQAEQVFELWTTERGIANDLRRQRAEKDAKIYMLTEDLEKESP